jgi:hypothetical protein
MSYDRSFERLAILRRTRAQGSAYKLKVMGALLQQRKVWTREEAARLSEFFPTSALS